MKDDFSKDEKNSSSMKQSDNFSSANEDSLDWAKQAYLQLKQKQKEQKELLQKEIEETEILNNRNTRNDDIKLNISAENTLQTSKKLQVEEEPQLGDFDDTFTWSAKVLAAQGKKIGQFSLDEIDWLGRLKQGLEKFFSS